MAHGTGSPHAGGAALLYMTLCDPAPSVAAMCTSDPGSLASAGVDVRSPLQHHMNDDFVRVNHARYRHTHFYNYRRATEESEWLL